MKKTYLQPYAVMGSMETESIICSSQGVTSNNGITYGGVDDGGTLDPASRRLEAWEEESGEDF